MANLLAAADELATYRETDSVLGRAVELTRECIGLERVGLYIRDKNADRIIMRGTWGTGAQGQTIDERGLHHEYSPHNCHALLKLQPSGVFGLYQNSAPLFAVESGRSVVIGTGWVVCTPLITGRNLLGVMYNDAALTGSAVDESKQVVTAVFCSLLASLLLSRTGGVGWRPLPSDAGQGPLVRRILQAFHQEPLISGERLAKLIGVSAGHLARSFKREMGVSLVEYRNRLRMERFFASMDRGQHNLLDAALEAGFGSYAQFHRVHRQLIGTTPREYFVEHRRGASTPVSRNPPQLSPQSD